MESLTRPPRRSFRLAARLALACAAAAASILGLGSCTFIEELFFKNAAWHAKYRDSTKNLIAARTFTASTIDLAATDPARTGVWAWPWMANPDAQGFDYMTFDLMLTTPPSELPSDTPVYRLELKNLARLGPGTVGGDFEYGPAPTLLTTKPGTATDLQWWVKTNAGTDDISNDPTNPGGYRIRNTHSGAEYLAYDLSYLADSPSLSSQDRKYRWRGRGRLGDIANYAVWDGSIAPTEFSQIPANPSTWIELPLQPEVNYPTKTCLYFGGSVASLELDDIRILREDIDTSLRLRLAIGDTDPPLIASYYEFSVYARRPPGATAPGESGAVEPYASTAVRLEMNAVGANTAPQIAASYNIDGTWQRLVLRGINFNFAPTETGAVMELVVRPYGDSIPDAGQVLLAAPTLNIYYAGYPD